MSWRVTLASGCKRGWCGKSEKTDRKVTKDLMQKSNARASYRWGWTVSRRNVSGNLAYETKRIRPGEKYIIMIKYYVFYAHNIGLVQK